MVKVPKHRSGNEKTPKDQENSEIVFCPHLFKQGIKLHRKYSFLSCVVTSQRKRYFTAEAQSSQRAGIFLFSGERPKNKESVKLVFILFNN
jgi:hypothetical protein